MMEDSVEQARRQAGQEVPVPPDPMADPAIDYPEGPSPFYLDMIDDLLERRAMDMIYVRTGDEAAEVEKQVQIAAQFHGFEVSTRVARLDTFLLGVDVDAREKGEES